MTFHNIINFLSWSWCFFQVSQRLTTMRRILQSGLTRTATYIFHIRGHCLSCRHVMVQPHFPLNTLHISKKLFGSWAHIYKASLKMSICSHLRDEHKVTHTRWMSKSSQPDSQELSLDNPRVQAYLRRLREDHDQNREKSQMPKNRAHLMMLLDQVRTGEVRWCKYYKLPISSFYLTLGCYKNLDGCWFPCIASYPLIPNIQ